MSRRINRRRLLKALPALAGLLGMPARARAQGKGNAPMNDKKRGSRLEPLFLSEADAREVMREHCMQGVNFPISTKQVDFLVSRLRPQFWLAHHKDGVAGLGETRFGGAPDLPKGMAWPIRPVSTDIEKITKQWKDSHGWIIKQMQHALPFEFFGQIDLAEAARSPDSCRGPADRGTSALLLGWRIGLSRKGRAHVSGDL